MNKINKIIKILKQIKPIYLITAAVIIIVLIIVIVFSFGHKSKPPVRNIPPRPINQIQTSINIGTNGDIHVFGVSVSTLQKGLINATGTVQNNQIGFSIKTDKSTIIREANNKISSVNKIGVGDVLIITGSLESFSPIITLMAKDIRVIGKYLPKR